MEKINESDRKVIYGGLNKSLLFTSAIGISYLDNTLCNIMNAITKTIRVNNASPLYKSDIYALSNPMVRIGYNPNHSSIGFW